MTNSLSPNTQAILLLSAPLIIGRGTPAADLLAPSEYRRLAKFLWERQRQPAHLLATEGESLLRDCNVVIDSARLKRLLERGFQLSQAMERWQSRGIWVVSRADASYPKRLKARLKEDAPALLYGCGDSGMLDDGGLAVVGSRNADDELIAYTESVGRLAADAGRTLVSGGARGVDQAAMRGALEAGGKAIGILADSLERASMNRDNRNHLIDRRLVLTSPYDPCAGFNVGHAMQRNKLIYALANAALVVNADHEKGGTWAGAIEQLERLHFVPVYVRSNGKGSKALDALQRRGALPWPTPVAAEELGQLLDLKDSRKDAADGPADLFSIAGEPPAPNYPSLPVAAKTSLTAAVQTDLPNRDLAGELFAKVRELLRCLPGSCSEAEVAAILQVSKTQAKEWLDRAVQEGWGEKYGKPARYHFHAGKQPDLFNRK